MAISTMSLLPPPQQKPFALLQQFMQPGGDDHQHEQRREELEVAQVEADQPRGDALAHAHWPDDGGLQHDYALLGNAGGKDDRRHPAARAAVLYRLAFGLSCHRAAMIASVRTAFAYVSRDSGHGQAASPFGAAIEPA